MRENIAVVKIMRKNPCTAISVEKNTGAAGLKKNQISFQEQFFQPHPRQKYNGPLIICS
jgi:hypothetical protein